MLSAPVCAAASAAVPPPAALSSWQLGRLRLSLGAQPSWGAPAEDSLLLIPCREAIRLRPGRSATTLQPLADLLYLPAEATDLRADAFWGWRLSLERPQLCRLASELSEHRLSPARFQRRLKQARVLELRPDASAVLAAALRQLLEMVASPPLRQHGQLELLELDRMILRLVVLLLCGDLIDAARLGHTAQAGQRQRVFEDLLAWIQAHADQRIQLQDLVQQSGYSQRSLRHFFRERFGCAPVEWIRCQRLQNARLRLLNPQPHDTVSAIATALGYSHPSQFSRDFQRTFGSRPSALLREGRRNHGLG